MTKVTEKTLVPISLVLVLAGGVSWLTSMESKASENSKNIDFLRQEFSERNKNLNGSFNDVIEKLQNIRERLVKIETELKKMNRGD